MIARSLSHYWPWHLGLFAGVAVAAAVVSGSLITGDSVRATLARQAEQRLGKVHTAAVSADGFFTSGLADRIRGEIPGSLAAAVLMLEGTVTEPGQQQRAGGVTFMGVTPEYYTLAGGRDPLPEGLVLNAPLAAALGMTKPGGEVILKFEKPSLISRDAPLSGESDLTVTLRLAVAAILPVQGSGAFTLKAEQTPPLTACLPLRVLQEAAQLPGRANLFLSDAPADKAEAALAAAVTPEDAGLTSKTAGDWRITASSGIFFNPQMIHAKTEVEAQQPVLTYLVNEIRHGDSLTPYSMACAAPPGLAGLPAWPEGSVVVNQWLADDLKLKSGDKLTLSYYAVLASRQIKEATAEFTVHSILPMDHPAVRQEWTPDFPGVSETENCRDWRPGIPVKQSLIRDKDDAYWKQYRGTPKLWLTYPDGRKLWQNRFGSVTALWQPAAVKADPNTWPQRVTPAQAGIVTVDVRAAAGRAVANSMDFGALFVSMSAFLIATALMLSLLLLQLGMRQRATQMGLLRATGWTGKAVRRLFIREAAAVVIPAALLGTLAGVAYTAWTLGRLESDWQDASLGLSFVRTIQPLTLGLAFLSTTLLALGAVWLAARKTALRLPRLLLAGGWDEIRPGAAARDRNWRRFFPIGLAAGLAAAMLAWSPRAPQHIAPMLFFGAAACLLIDGLRLLGRWLQRRDASAAAATGMWSMGLRNAARNGRRSVALTGLMGAGIFMVVAMNAFRQDARQQPNTRGSGAGGFTFVATSSGAIYEDLQSPEGRRVWDLEEKDMAGVTVIPFRVRAGEEASCLNLNRAQTPRLMGVEPGPLAQLKAFPFASAINDQGWNMLSEPPDENGALPAIMDQYSAMFAMGKMQGDIITVSDSEGAPVKLRLVGLLAGTVLQGSILLSSENFVRLYPDSGGYRYWLMDVPEEKAEAFRAMAVEQFSTRGLSLVRATERLAQFQAVQNTYLTIFSTLGGLALLLSTVGLAVLVARHVIERRSELATLRACGFRHDQVRTLVVAEHWFLLAIAIAIGCACAALAVWPHLHMMSRSGIPWGLLAGLLTAFALLELITCRLAAQWALRGRLTDGLRAE